MPEYRIYQIAQDSQNAYLAEVIQSENDERAVECARYSARVGTNIEVWEGRRLVASIKGEERPRSEERPRGA